MVICPYAILSKYWASSKEAARTIFKVFGITRPGFEHVNLPDSQTTLEPLHHRIWLRKIKYLSNTKKNIKRLLFCTWSVAAGYIIAGSIALLLMQCPLFLVSWYSFCQPQKDHRLVLLTNLVLLNSSTGLTYLTVQHGLELKTWRS